MRTLNQITNDVALSTEEFREIRKAVIYIRYVNLAGRTVLPVRKISIGKQEYGVDYFEESGAADVVAKATNFPGMQTSKDRELIHILKHGIAFNISREDLLSSRESGEPLRTSSATRASKLVQNKENNTIILGNALYGVDGLYSGAAGTHGGADWTNSANDPTDDILAAMKELGDPYEATDLLLNKVQYLELHRRNTNTDKTYMEIVKSLGITPKVDRDIAAGTGLLMESGKDIAELIVAEDLDVEEDYKLENQSYIFNAYLRSVPAIYEDEALVTLTGI